MRRSRVRSPPRALLNFVVLPRKYTSGGYSTPETVSVDVSHLSEGIRQQPSSRITSGRREVFRTTISALSSGGLSRTDTQALEAISSCRAGHRQRDRRRRDGSRPGNGRYRSRSRRCPQRFGYRNRANRVTPKEDSRIAIVIDEKDGVGKPVVLGHLPEERRGRVGTSPTPDDRRAGSTDRTRVSESLKRPTDRSDSRPAKQVRSDVRWRL